MVAAAAARRLPAVGSEPAVKMQMHPIVRGYLPLALHETSDGSTFVTAGPLALRVPSTGALVRDPHALDGREAPDTRIWSIASFGGAWRRAPRIVGRRPLTCSRRSGG